MCNCIVERLQKILMQERDAIFRGNFEKLTEFITIKESLLKKLSREKLSESQFEKIASNVARNQSIIESAISGIKSARQHVLIENSPNQSAVFYNRSGVLEFYNGNPLGVMRKY